MLDYFFIASLLVQCAHSLEELVTGFHKKWYLFRMPFFVFLAFEIIFLSFFVFVQLNSLLPFRSELQAFFLLLMFANGVQHVVWAACVRTYVPGLLTAPLHLLVFVFFFFSSIV